MKFDLRFVEIGYELMILREYLAMLENDLPRIIEAEKSRIWSNLDRGDEADRSTGWHLEQRLDEGVTTRFLTGAAIIGIWAIYEGSIQRFAEHLQKDMKLTLHMSTIKGSFLERARTYFADVLKFDLHPPQTDWQRLNRIADLRHVLAHTNGRLRDVRQETIRRMQPWLNSTTGLTVVGNEFVVVALPFAQETLQFIEDLLIDLRDRVCEAT